jgi:hypothetical protein
MKGLPIAGGVIGAVLGFIGALLLLELVGFGNPQDPILTGLLALLVFGPAGAVGGLVLGTKLATRPAADGRASGVGRNILKSFAVLIGLVVVIGGLWAWYEISTATPWLNPNAGNPRLQFEVRLPAGAALPGSVRDINTELQTDLNTMPGELRADQFRRDNDRAVIVGQVDLAFRTPYRQLEVKIPGQPTRVYPIKLTDRAPHTPELGPWQALPDGSDIRYRAKWPGKE